MKTKSCGKRATQTHLYTRDDCSTEEGMTGVVGIQGVGVLYNNNIT